jgi:hypothetical protein
MYGKPHERAALADSGMTVVFFRRTFHNTSLANQTIKAIRFWPKVVELTGRCQQPTLIEVSPSGAVSPARRLS